MSRFEAAGTDAPATAPATTYTVGEIVARLRGLIDRQFPAAIWVEGQLSDCTYHTSGHIYFSLKDEQATDRRGQPFVLPCAFFRGANQSLKFKLTDGLKVLCSGQVTMYEARSQFQLQVLRVEPKGIGALQLAFEQLKKRLQAEGLFDEARKRPIPSVPDRVALITSPTGSAVHDMVSKLRGRFHVIVLPVRVQGEGASKEIAEALDTANRLHLGEVVIVGRGGGSVEDLWAFNEEPVARAMARSRIPVISAVGHQDDWTIADYVADLRCSTPTDAAKHLVRQQETFVEGVEELVQQLLDRMTISVDEALRSVDELGGRLRLLHPLHQLNEYSQRAEQLEEDTIQFMHHLLERKDRELYGVAGRLQALSPLAVLERGYSVTFALPQRRLVTDAASVREGESLETLLAKGRVISTVTRVDREVEFTHDAD